MPSSSSQHLCALPVEVWSLISDYATSAASERDGLDTQRTCLSSLRCTSHALNLLLSSDAYYRARVVDAIKSLDELETQRSAFATGTDSVNLTSERPRAEAVGGYKNLFHILVTWSALEGWYTLCDAWPWGYLVLIKFCDGMLCGEVIFVSPEDESVPSSSQDDCNCKRKRIFEVSFDSSGQASCAVIGKKAESFGVKWKGGITNNNTSYHKVKKSDVFRSLQIRNDLGDDLFPRNDGLLFHISNILKNETDTDNESNDPFFSDMSEVDDSLHVPMPTCVDIIQTLLQREIPIYKYKQSGRRPSYVKRLQEYYPSGLLFEYLCGPTGRPLREVKAPKSLFQTTDPLAPGFYVGKNNRKCYQRHLRYEVVQVRNHQVQIASNNTPHDIMLMIRESLKVSKTDYLPSFVDLIQNQSTHRSLSFVSGRKVTGDINVPTGELAWIAVTTGTRDIATFPTPPLELVKGSECHQVTNAWPGWKQLARPFYCDSSWKKGWLLELRGTRNADDEWGEGFEYCDEAQYAFWLPEEHHSNNFILSKLPCHFGSYLWEV